MSEGGDPTQPADDSTWVEPVRATEATVPAHARSRPGAEREPSETLGRYRLLGAAGKGGMGVVYVALDPELNRRVAIKVLLTHGFEDLTVVRERLLREARALAQVNDANVLVVNDVGEHDGRVFVAMEYVDGQTLTAWLRESRRPLAEIVRVFVDAGRGLAAAHAAGVVHGDFKPDNVMIDRTGRVRVMDFGLARVHAPTLDEPDRRAGPDTDPSRSTVRGRGAGTPAYMAPEQHLGEEVEPRTDQFSFCVALYEALYGERPFAGSTLHELALAVTAGEIRPPPAGASVPARVRAVLLVGVRTQHCERFATMDACLAALARASSRPRRARILAAALVPGALALAFALRPELADACERADALASLWTAASAAAIESSLRGFGARGDEAWFRLEPVLVQYASSWADASVEVCLALRDPAAADLSADARARCLSTQREEFLAIVGALELADTEVVAHAVEAAAELPSPQQCTDAGPVETPVHAACADELQRELAEARAQRSLGKYARAEELATALTERANACGDSRPLGEIDLLLAGLQTNRADYAAAEASLARSYFAARDRGDDAAAAAAAIELVMVVGANLSRPDEGLQWAEHARASLARTPSTTSDGDLAAAIGDLERERGNLDMALSSHRRALELRTGVHGDRDLRVATSLDRLGMLLSRLERSDEAIEHLERALAIQREHLGPRHPRVVRTLTNLATVRSHAAQNEQALATFGEILAILDETVGPGHVDVAKVVNNRAHVQLALGRFPAALADFQRAHQILREVRGEQSKEVALVLDNIGLALSDMGDHAGALDHHERALAMVETILGTSHPLVAQVLNNVGNEQDLLGEPERSRRSFERALDVLDQIDAPAIDRADPMSNLGTVCMRLKDRACAEHALRESLRLREEALGPDHPEVAISLANLALMATDSGEHARAKEMLVRAVAITEATSGVDSIPYSITMHSLGVVEARLGDPGAAIARIEIANGIVERAGADPEDVGQTRLELAKAYWAAGRRTEAKQTARRALEIFANSGLREWESDVEAWLRAPNGTL